MDQTPPDNLLMNIKAFLIEKKNLRLILLGLSIFIVFISIVMIVLSSITKPNESQKKTSGNIGLSPSPTKTLDQINEETIQSLGFSIDCQLIVETSKKKIYVRRLNTCETALDYKISPSKKYASYITIDKNKASQLFIYSLDNNVEGQLQVISKPIIEYMFDNRNNLVIRLNDRLVYYFVSLLFSGYPGNYYRELNTFTDIDKRRVEIPFGDVKITNSKMVEQQDGFVFTDSAEKTIFSIRFTDLDTQLSPSPAPKIDRNLLQWDKRIFLYTNNEFKTMDIDGSNTLSHQFLCDGLEVVPINFRDNLMARSPDGQTLAFLAPTDVQMREDSTWKEDILSGKKVFDQGEIALYDFVKNTCQRTGIVQTITFKETFNFSPNGQYLTFVNKGLSLYNLQDHQDYQLVSHNPTRESDGTAVSGPLAWDGASKFIYTLVSKIDSNGLISSTNLVRVYFDEQFNGTEQIIIPLTNDSLYAVSSDGSKVLYTKSNQLYKYDVDRKLNSLFSNDSVNKITKIVWLRDGTVISNLWYANENLYFTKLPAMDKFQIDFGGSVIVYMSGPLNQINLYDLNLNRQKFFKDKQTVSGDILRLFY